MISEAKQMEVLFMPNNKRFTQSGTDIEEVKRQNALGSSRQPNGTNPKKVRAEIAQESGFAGQASMNQNQAGLGRTASGTDIQEVRKQNAKAEQAKNRNQ